MSNVYLSPPTLIPVTAVTTALTANQSGSIIFLNPGGVAAQVITLPAPAQGLNFKFVVQTVSAARAITINPNGTDRFYGILLVNEALVACAAKASITGTANAQTIGDNLEIFCDGTNWHVRGFAVAATGWA